MLKAAIKKGAGEDQVRHRIVPPEVVSKWSQTLDNLKEEVSAVLQDEKQEKQVGGFGALLQSFS
jgi:ATP-dependent RNA helicase DDX27